MANYISPLVAVLEEDLSSYIASDATSIGVIVLRNVSKGPDMKKVLITNEDELISTFGEPTNVASNYQDMLSACGFLRYGNQLYCTAVRPNDATFAGLMSTIETSGSEEIVVFNTLEVSGSNSITLDYFNSGDVDDFAEEANPIGPFDVIASSRGKHGNNIRIVVVNSNVYDTVERKEQDISKYKFSNVLLGIDNPIDASDKKSFLLIVQTLVEGADETDEDYWDTVEVFNVSTDQKAIDDEGGTRFAETVINSTSQYVRFAFNELQKDKDFTFEHTDWMKFDGGFDGDSSADLDSQVISAYELYKNAEEVDINIVIDSNKSETVKVSLVELCESRKDCMVLLDCLKDQVVNNRGSETTALIKWRKGLTPYETTNVNFSSDYAALYGNWIEVYDKWNAKYRWIPASGYVAGIYANTDTVSDPWFAPAGLNRALLISVRRLGFNPDQAKRDLLYKNGINPIVSFSGQGKVIWGQKTMLDKASAFNRVNVRRLFITIEKAVATASKYYLFEPNDARTRIQLINLIEPYLSEVRSRRGIYDFRIVCDERNNTPERIDRGELWCDILIKPTKATEYLILRFTATKTGASFEEIISSSVAA